MPPKDIMKKPKQKPCDGCEEDKKIQSGECAWCCCPTFTRWNNRRLKKEEAAKLRTTAKGSSLRI